MEFCVDFLSKSQRWKGDQTESIGLNPKSWIKPEVAGTAANTNGVDPLAAQILAFTKRKICRLALLMQLNNQLIRLKRKSRFAGGKPALSSVMRPGLQNCFHNQRRLIAAGFIA